VLERKRKILNNFLGRSYKSNEEYLYKCPKCGHHKRKLSVNFDKNVFKCWICDYSGKNIFYLVRSHGSHVDKQDWKKVANIVDFSEQEKEIQKIEVELPKEFITLTGKHISPLSIPARKYLADRGITEEQIIWWKMGYCPDGKYANRIVVPSFDMEGELTYFISRSYDNNWIKYLNPPAEKDFIFNELYLDWNKDITIVEGVFDAVAVGNAIPLLGSTIKEDSYVFQTIVEKCDTLYFALDADAAAKEDKIINLFMSYGIECYKIDTTGFDDVGEMDKATYKERKKNAELLSFGNYLERLLYQ
jgi:DNA primase